MLVSSELRALRPSSGLNVLYHLFLLDQQGVAAERRRHAHIKTLSLFIVKSWGRTISACSPWSTFLTGRRGLVKLRTGSGKTLRCSLRTGVGTLASAAQPLRDGGILDDVFYLSRCISIFFSGLNRGTLHSNAYDC